MEHDRFREIVDARNREHDAKALNQSREDEATARHQALTAAWNDAFPPILAGQSPREYAEIVAHRLIDLAPEMISRFWDFHIGSYLSVPQIDPEFELDKDVEMVLLLLKYACMGQRESIIDALAYAHDFIPSLSFTQRAMIHRLDIGLPNTPYLSQSELARILGISKPKLRGDILAKRWKCAAGQRYVRFRLWMHRDAEIQKDALLKMRKHFAEKIFDQSPRHKK